MDTENEIYVVGTVESVFFENAENFFKIILITVEETNTDWKEPEIVVTGYFGELETDQQYKFVGSMVSHPKYGKQFKSNSYVKINPTDRQSLINYFSGDLFLGIGKKTAEKIIDKLGSDPIQQILIDESSLDGLGLSTEKKEMIITQVQENHETEQILLSLNQLGIGNAIATKIYQAYHEKTLEIVMNNPYKLVEDINGIGFKKADSIAAELKFEPDDPRRIRGAILHVLSLLSAQDGNTYANENKVVLETNNLLSSSRYTEDATNIIISQIEQLVVDGLIIKEDNHLYLKYLYDTEWSIASNIKMLADGFKINLSDKKIDKAINDVESLFKIDYDDSQRKAIKKALQSPIFLLTGGPGTGKTTIINGIVAAYAKLHGVSLDITNYEGDEFPIALAAPTGRAAKQMADTTGLPASTIHRLLGLNGGEDITEVTVSEISARLLIIDEMSMVDASLFKQLLNAVNPGTQVILVGDKDQLPSVGPGQVFSDLIESNTIETIKLNFIYRQGIDSSITKLAHNINEGIVDDNLFKNFSDRSFIECSANQIPNVIEQVFTKVKLKGFDIDNVQTLAPMYKGVAGIDNLNLVIQNILNPMDEKRKNVKFGNIDYRIGDKVVHLVNNSENNVFNGEIGIITGITYAKDSEYNSDELHFNFSGQEISYTRADWNKISLAYCTSIHKAQGSEFELVIMPLVMQSKRMLKRNLLYTGVTRAKKLLIMMGDRKAYVDAINDVSSKRNTTLIKRLFKVFKIKSAAISENTEESNVKEESTIFELTNDVILNNDIDPMIGMNNISPYDLVN